MREPRTEGRLIPSSGIRANSHLGSIYKEDGNGAVVIDETKGQYYQLHGLALEILRSCEEDTPITLQCLIRRLERVGDQHSVDEVATVVGQLLERGLLLNGSPLRQPQPQLVIEYALLYAYYRVLLWWRGWEPISGCDKLIEPMGADVPPAGICPKRVETPCWTKLWQLHAAPLCSRL